MNCRFCRRPAIALAISIAGAIWTAGLPESRGGLIFERLVCPQLAHVECGAPCCNSCYDCQPPQPNGNASENSGIDDPADGRPADNSASGGGGSSRLMTAAAGVFSSGAPGDPAVGSTSGRFRRSAGIGSSGGLGSGAGAGGSFAGIPVTSSSGTSAGSTAANGFGQATTGSAGEGIGGIPGASNSPSGEAGSGNGPGGASPEPSGGPQPVGSALSNPISPNPGTSYVFNYTITPGGLGNANPLFFDPPAATGYNFQILSGPNFASVEVPESLPTTGQSEFTLVFGNHVEDLFVGIPFFFTSVDPGGVSQFSITGILVDNDLDPNAQPPTFDTAITFVGGGHEGSFSQTPILNTPEPGSLTLLALGAAGLWAARRRKRTKFPC